MDVPWIEDRVIVLKALWAAGLSASKIAAEMGGLTRNAVIGKANRLGLVGRRIKLPPRERRQRKPRTVICGPTLAPVDSGPPGSDDNAIPFSQRRTLLELTEDTCRWPIGDPRDADFHFCGGDAVGSLPYCNHHSVVSCQRPRGAGQA